MDHGVFVAAIVVVHGWVDGCVHAFLQAFHISFRARHWTKLRRLEQREELGAPAPRRASSCGAGR